MYRFMALLLAAVAFFPLNGQDDRPEPASCSETAVYGALDFWLGDWQVHTADGQMAGSNRIEKILNGCAVLEHWTSKEGSAGKSLFYVWQGEWRQVWVTDYASRPGGTKEKRQVDLDAEQGLRFQGTIRLLDGRTYLDRTTLTPLDDGTVRQLIEYSTDRGENWKTGFDAIYSRP